MIFTTSWKQDGRDFVEHYKRNTLTSRKRRLLAKKSNEHLSIPKTNSGQNLGLQETWGTNSKEIF